MQTLQKLWRGEIGLGRTYWLWGNVIYGILLVVVGSFIAGVVSGLTSFVFLVYIYISFLFVAGLFMNVAIWRSAGNYDGPKGWAITARILVGIGFCGQLIQLVRGFGLNKTFQ
jgi:hypothetical protein